MLVADEAATIGRIEIGSRHARGLAVMDSSRKAG